MKLLEIINKLDGKQKVKKGNQNSWMDEQIEWVMEQMISGHRKRTKEREEINKIKIHICIIMSLVPDWITNEPSMLKSILHLIWF